MRVDSMAVDRVREMTSHERAMVERVVADLVVEFRALLAERVAPRLYAPRGERATAAGARTV